MLTVICSYCGLKILAPLSVQGREGSCLNCGNPITVPKCESPTSAATLQFNPGDKIADRYSILSFIGKGGMGVVYQAEDSLVKEDVALKFLLPNILRTEKGRRMFLQEAQIARRLRHENIIAVHDVSYTGEGVLFLSMEYGKGKSLRQMLQQHRLEKCHIPPRLIVSIALQVLNALQYAHRLVIHRDIKPENILLAANENVKVLDFGLAKAVEEEDAANRDGPGEQRKKRQVVGTLAYAAPEQIYHRPVDLRADIYSLGLVLRELLTLRTPMEQSSAMAIQREDVAPDVIDVINRAVSEDRSERWQSAAAFRDALQAAFEEAYHPAAVMNNHAARQAVGSTSDMVFFRGGNFLMGNDAVREEAPEEEVYVEPFWMDTHPVTVFQDAQALEASGAQEPKFWRDTQLNGPEQPVVGVSWDEAMAFAAWAGKSLPTEAQWEFAARGQENRRYPRGNSPPDTTLFNYSNYLGKPSMVTMHEDGKTPEGLLDMAGNVFEWTLDPYVPYKHIRQKNGSLETSPRKTARGGCYESDMQELATTTRKGFFQNVRQRNLGFRCVINAATLPQE